MSDGWQPPKGHVAASSPAGWYQQPEGRMRWWDGGQWTEHFHTPEDPRQGQAKNPTAVASRVLNPSVQTNANHQDIIWSATGQPMTGIGAGRYWLTGHDLYFEKVTLSTDSQQVPIATVTDIDEEQGHDPAVPMSTDDRTRLNLERAGPSEHCAESRRWLLDFSGRFPWSVSKRDNL